MTPKARKIKNLSGLMGKAADLERNCGITASIRLEDGVPYLHLPRQLKVTDGVLVARVRASNPGEVYEIRKQMAGSWTCSCKAYRFGRGEIGKKFPCKHLRSLWNGWRTKDVMSLAGVAILEPQYL